MKFNQIKDVAIKKYIKTIIKKNCTERVLANIKEKL
jgi:hypothetical protein